MTNLNQYTTHQLESELLSRKECQFNKPGCTKKATNYLAKKLGACVYQKDPICANCLEEVWAAIIKDYDKAK